MSESSPPARGSAPEPAPAPSQEFAPAPEPAHAPGRLTAAGPGWLAPLVLIGLAMAALTVVSTAAVLIAGPDVPVATPNTVWVSPAGGGPNYVPGSPEAAYETYVQAIAKGNYTAADEMLSSRARSNGETARDMGPFVLGENPVVIAVSSASDEATATLEVKLQISPPDGTVSGGPPSVVGETVGLVRENGDWKVDTLKDG